METNVKRVVVYCDIADEWRWRGEAGNGEPVTQGEGHTRPEDARRAARGVLGREVPIFRETVSPDGNAVTIDPWEDDDAESA